MNKEIVLEKTREAFKGHNVVLSKAVSCNDKELYVLIVGGQSYAIEDFMLMSEQFKESGLKILFYIESNVLTIRMTKE